MNRNDLYKIIDQIARYDYIKNRIDPSGLYDEDLMDIDMEEIEGLYIEAFDKVASSIEDKYGTSLFSSASDLKDEMENDYQEKLEEHNYPDSFLARLDFYTRSEKKYLSNKYVNIDASGLPPSGLPPSGINPSGLGPYGINTYFV